MPRPRRSPASSPWPRRLLLLALGVVGLLSVWAAHVSRQHHDVVQSTLEEYAFLAAERFARALDREVQERFYGIVFRARHLHRREVGADPGLPPDPAPIPAAALLAYVSIDPLSGEVRVNEGSLPGEEWAGWIGERVRRHVREVYRTKPQAPYAGLTRVGEDSFHELVYRMEPGVDGGEPEAFGALVDMTGLAPVYESVHRATRVLPPSVALRVDDPDRILAVTLRAPDGGPVFWRSGPLPPEGVSGADVGAGRAGRTRVSVDLDPAAADLLVPGGLPRAPLSLALVLGALALGLLLLSYVQTRRERRLVRMREDFVANVSHELRTPLAQIRMFTESLLLGRLSSAEDRRRSLEVVHRETDRLSTMVENLLALSTATRSPDLGRSTADPVAVARETVESLRPLATERRATVVVEGVGGERADFNVAAFRRSLLNLLDNALKYGPRGQTVTVAVGVENGSVTLSVADQGPGIPAGHRNAIWERFSRLEGGPRDEGGTGLGLAVVKEMVQGLGGSVDVQDGADRGAHFRVRLPASTPEEAP